MPLFASLSKTKAFSETVGKSNKQGTSSSSPAFPPTAIQFYSTKSIDLQHQSIINHAHATTGTSGNGASTTENKFAPLTYHTSTIAHSSNAANTTSTNTTEANANNRTIDNPDLALWNCHIQPDSQTPSELLKACHSHPASCTSSKNKNSNSNCIPTFLLTLDLDSHNSESGLGSIQPIVKSMLQNIILYCRSIANSTNVGSGSAAGTGNGTHLKTLESTIFGKAPLSEENDTKGQYTPAENTTAAVAAPTTSSEKEIRAAANVQVNIVICGIMAAKQDEGTSYREKQAVNLISYHLQKFSSEINCTLCFMRDHDSSDDHGENGNSNNNDDKDHINKDAEKGKGEMKVDAFRPKGLSLVEFSKALRRLCVADSEQEGGDDDDNDDEVEDGEVGGGNGDVGQGQNEGEGADSSLSGQHQQHQHQQPSIYAPFDYDVDLINSVLLRGAGCPGVWNANTDSLWVALPQTSASGSSNMESNTAATATNANGALAVSDGDQEWLGKLAESVSAYVGNSGGSGSDGKSIRSSMDQTTRTTRTSANNTVATKKKVVRKKPSATGDKKEDSKDVHDFFAELLNNK